MEAVEVTDNDPASVLLSLLLVATVEAMEVVVELVKCLPPPEEDDRRTGGGGLVTSEATANTSSSFSKPEAGGMGELMGGGVALRGSGTLKTLIVMASKTASKRAYLMRRNTRR